MLATAVCSMWISNTATALMMLPVALAVLEGGKTLPDALAEVREARPSTAEVTLEIEGNAASFTYNPTGGCS